MQNLLLRRTDHLVAALVFTFLAAVVRLQSAEARPVRVLVWDEQQPEQKNLEHPWNI